MKTPHRRFVVEFKSGRRQPKAQTNSIWGDTDLKALAREVGDAAPHLFNSNEAPATADSGETKPSDPIDAKPANERAAVEDAVAAIPFANGAEVEISKHYKADNPAEAVVQVQDSQPASHLRTKSTDTSRKRTKRAPVQTIARMEKPGHEDPKPQTGTVDNPISLDELAGLEADNKRLKRLLVEQLLEENLLLKKMLERFDANSERWRHWRRQN